MVRPFQNLWRPAIVFLVFILGLCDSAMAQEEDVLPDRNNARESITLKELTPTYAVSLRPPHLSAVQPTFPINVLGYDLRQHGRAIESQPPTVEERAPCEFTVYWHAHTVPTSELIFFLRLEGTGPLLEERFTATTDRWQPGGVYQTTHVYVNRGSRYAGDATLRLSASLGNDTELAPLFVGPFHIAPALAASRIPAEQIREFFGPNHRRLNVAARLGAGAHVTVPIEAEDNRPVPALGLVSRGGYDAFFEQGAVIAVIECRTDSDNGVQRLEVRYGVHTAHSDYDKYPVGRLAHAKVPVFSSRDVAATDETPAFARHLYVGRLPVPSPAVITELNVAYQRDDGVLDIEDIVLAYQ